MKILIVSLALLLLLEVSISPSVSPVGVKIAINESIILKAQQKFFPMIIDSVKKIQIPDKEFTIATSVITTQIKIRDIKINLGQLKSENIAIKLEDDAVLTVTGSKIKATGEFTVDVTAGYIPKVTDSVTINVKKLDLIVSFRIGWMNHPSFKGRQTVSVVILDIKADLDFDFEIKGSVLSTVKSYFQDTIQKKFHEYFQTALKDTILPILNKSINKAVEDYPIYVPLYDKIVMDYSLLSEPRIENGLMTLYIDGKIVQRHDPNDIDNFPFNSIMLPKIPLAAKGLKVLISPFTINTALYSLFYSSKLVYAHEISNIINIIPKKESLFELLHPFNTFRSILKNKFGEQRKGIVDLTFTKVPQIKLENSKFISDVVLKIAFSVDKDGKWDLFNGYEAEITIVAQAGVTEGGQINAKIEKITVNKFQIIYNNLEQDLDLYVIKTIVNWGIEKGRESINDALLAGYEYKPPVVYGMTFLDSKATIQSDHIEIELGATFADAQRLFLRKKKK